MVSLGDWRSKLDMDWSAVSRCGVPLSVVLEVGVVTRWTGEYLEGDVRGWIESRGSLVNMVVTVSVGLLGEPWTMAIETWEPYHRGPMIRMMMIIRRKWPQ